MTKYIYLLLISAAALASSPAAMAQSTETAAASESSPLVIEPLFEYPSAPEELQGLQDRSDWLMEHFWEKMDFKNRHAVDQNALNDAFQIYTAPMRFADAEKVNTSVTKLLEVIAKNPTLSLQFAKAAEESLYGPRAYVWNDPIFLRFVDNVLSNKNIKKERKLRYQHLRNIVGNTLKGTTPPEFDYVTPEGKKSHYHPNGVITVIEFGDPDCLDCRLSKLKMDTDVKFSTLVDRGKINVLFINPEPEDGWQQKLSGYPSKWYVGASEEVSDLYDLRETPSIYVIDREGKVAVKNVDVATAMQIASAAAEQ